MKTFNNLAIRLFQFILLVPITWSALFILLGSGYWLQFWLVIFVCGLLFYLLDLGVVENE